MDAGPREGSQRRGAEMGAAGLWSQSSPPRSFHTAANQRVCWVEGKVQASEKGCMARFASLKLVKQLWGLPQTCRDEVEVAILRVHMVFAEGDSKIAVLGPAVFSTQALPVKRLAMQSSTRAWSRPSSRRVAHPWPACGDPKAGKCPPCPPVHGSMKIPVWVGV